MNHCCAKIENGVVTWVTVGTDAEWCRQRLGGDWVYTQDLVSAGWTYSEANGFRPPQPYPSWSWLNGEWTPPVPQPAGSYVWDEDEQEWVAVQ